MVNNIKFLILPEFTNKSRSEHILKLFLSGTKILVNLWECDVCQLKYNANILVSYWCHNKWPEA